MKTIKYVGMLIFTTASLTLYAQTAQVINPNSVEFSKTTSLSDAINGSTFTIKPTKNLVIKSNDLTSYEIKSDTIDCSISRYVDTAQKATLAENGTWKGGVHKYTNNSNEFSVQLNKDEHSISLYCKYENIHFSGTTLSKTKLTLANEKCNGLGGAFNAKETELDTSVRSYKYHCRNRQPVAYGQLKELFAKNNLDIVINKKPLITTKEVIVQNTQRKTETSVKGKGQN